MSSKLFRVKRPELYTFEVLRKALATLNTKLLQRTPARDGYLMNAFLLELKANPDDTQTNVVNAIPCEATGAVHFRKVRIAF